MSAARPTCHDAVRNSLTRGQDRDNVKSIRYSRCGRDMIGPPHIRFVDNHASSWAVVVHGHGCGHGHGHVGLGNGCRRRRMGLDEGVPGRTRTRTRSRGRSGGCERDGGAKCERRSANDGRRVAKDECCLAVMRGFCPCCHCYRRQHAEQAAVEGHRRAASDADRR